MFRGRLSIFQSFVLLLDVDLPVVRSRLFRIDLSATYCCFKSRNPGNHEIYCKNTEIEIELIEKFVYLTRFAGVINFRFELS